jgi:hypothetical protein
MSATPAASHRATMSEPCVISNAERVTSTRAGVHSVAARDGLRVGEEADVFVIAYKSTLMTPGHSGSVSGPQTEAEFTSAARHRPQNEASGGGATRQFAKSSDRIGSEPNLRVPFDCDGLGEAAFDPVEGVQGRVAGLR